MSTYSSSGQFTIEELVLVYGDNQEIDLSLSFVQVDLYESIFNHTMSGHIAIIDSFNLQDILPIYGSEQIRIKFYTQGNEANPVYYKGIVCKVSPKHRISEHSSGYVIHFVSSQAVQSQQININRGFIDTPSKIVEQIYQRISDESEKGLETVKTKGVDTYTFGTVKPLQAIPVLCKHSYSYNNDHGYLFYEDHLQFNYKPLQFLYQQDPIRSYRSRNRGHYDNVTQHTQESHGTIQDLRLMEENSYMDRMMEGQHGTSFSRFDLFTKSIETFNYDKEQFYNPSKSLGELAHKKQIDITYDNRNTLRYSHNSKIDLAGISKGIMSQVELSTVRCEIVVFGDSTLRCGQLIGVNFPIWNQNQDEVTDMITGNFIMSDIHHQLTQDEKYMQTIMIQKEAYKAI